MRLGRAAWIGLNTASYICELVFLCLAIAAQISPDWAVYDVTYIGLIDDYNQLSRSRGLWKQCITNEIVSTSYNGQCYPLENCEEFSSYNDNVLPIFCLIYFISLLIYYENMSQENYRLDTELKSARSAWTTTVRDNTVYSPGGMIPMAWSACLLIYAGSILQMIASAIQQPPVRENYSL
ncbi:unnamed protein product [Schistosoma rodhaini]|uniref:Uncharacterized protein n=1 Tax=Schistosoma rodhaini TaxID=6188 RepID=A0AA85GDE3_9TREM|nr:unnamed protein product [Schistosoma rodhaini]